MPDESESRINCNAVLSTLCAAISLGAFLVLGWALGFDWSTLTDETLSRPEVSASLVGAFLAGFLVAALRVHLIEWSGWKTELREGAFSCVLYITCLALFTWIVFKNPANGGIWGSILQLPLLMGGVFVPLQAGAIRLAFQRYREDELR